MPSVERSEKGAELLSPDRTGSRRIARFAARFRRAPLGIVLLTCLFAMSGAGLMAGGGYVLLSGQSVTPWAGAAAILVGPAVLYVAYHLLRLTHWTWLALVMLTGLLFLSSVVRLIVSPGISVPAILEIIGELALAFYLSRPGVRQVFSTGPRSVSQAPTL
jgi:hypothetical protein